MTREVARELVTDLVEKWEAEAASPLTGHDRRFLIGGIAVLLRANVNADRETAIRAAIGSGLIIAREHTPGEATYAAIEAAVAKAMAP